MAHQLLDDHGVSDLEDELTEARDERVSPLILGAAVAGLLVGLFLWGSLAMSVVSSTGSLLDDISTNTEGAPAAIDTITPTSSPTPAPSVTPTPDPARNRLDCDAIRGTDYRSPEERAWFLANCVEG